jgi:hypothetical protein
MRKKALEKLFYDLLDEKIGSEELLSELNELIKGCSNVGQMQSLYSAIDWASIYANPRRSHLWGGRATVRACLLKQISEAILAQPDCD